MESHGGKGDPSKVAMPQKLPIPRRGYGTKGRGIALLTNHFKVSAKRTDVFHHYHVNLMYEDKQPVEQKGVSRNLISKLQETYASDLENKQFAYDGEKSLFTIGPLPFTKNVFPIFLEDASSGKTTTSRSPGGNGSPEASDKKRMRRPVQEKTFKVEVKFVAKVSTNSEEALQVLNIILRQQAAKQGCLLVGQSFFRNIRSNFFDLGCGVQPCRGFHSSFRPTQNGPSLNVDVSMTTIVKPGPVIDFLKINQNVSDLLRIDWPKAKRVLKNLRIKTIHTNSEFRIIGLSENTCYEQRDGDGSGTVEVTVYEYFMKRWSINLKDSAHFPCLNVGKPKRPTYVPLELCHLVPMQRYTKSLTTLQRSSLVDKSRQKPHDRMSVLSDAVRDSNYDSEPMLKECGISIARVFTQVDGRVLEAPKLKAGDGEYLRAYNGRWSFTKNRLFQGSKVKSWGLLIFLQIAVFSVSSNVGASREFKWTRKML